jgi:glutamyl-Q tRNA(Asp) synthetase
VTAGASAQPPHRGRFAPSPTGPLHFGSLIAALASRCDAVAAGAAWHVRIEDVDVQRARRGAEGAILRTLERYGFEWSGPVVRQSERTPLYETALERLRARGIIHVGTAPGRRFVALAQGGEHTK